MTVAIITSACPFIYASPKPAQKPVQNTSSRQSTASHSSSPNASANKSQQTTTPAFTSDSASNSDKSEQYYYTDVQRYWYGWQLWLADVPLLTTTFLAVRANKPALGYTALGLFSVAPSFVHGFHRRWIPFAVSALSRLTLSGTAVVTGPLIGRAFDSGAAEHKRRAAVVMVFGLGTSLADSFLLGYKQKEVQIIVEPEQSVNGRNNRQPVARELRVTKAWFAPQAAVLEGGGWFGISGGF